MDYDKYFKNGEANKVPFCLPLKRDYPITTGNTIFNISTQAINWNQMAVYVAVERIQFNICVYNQASSDVLYVLFMGEMSSYFGQYTNYITSNNYLGVTNLYPYFGSALNGSTNSASIDFPSGLVFRASTPGAWFSRGSLIAAQAVDVNVISSLYISGYYFTQIM